ncbi:MAG: hypothetical protein KGD64_13225, partial [Candidatus Heimdallarchaeota archaeon]|nr:hypothetical protein [Candidatus Heimdallarchaeota archaeon]
MKRKAALSVIFCLVITFSAINVISRETAEPFFNLVLIPYEGGGVRSDYGLYIAQYLREIGIEAEVPIDDTWIWPIIVNPYTSDDFDLTLTSIPNIKTHDLRSFYTEDGSLNIFRLNRSIPFQNESETMQNEAVSMSDLEERQQLYYDWQILMMDQILPLLPLFSSKTYEAIWANTNGFEACWGLIDSLPYIEYDGYHDGQESLTEFNVADANWRDLNPLQDDNPASIFLSKLMSESIVGWSPDFVPIKTSLVTDWKMIDEFHYTFTMRDDVYWNPSFNVTGRISSSIPLDVATTPLMAGLKNNEVSIGTNLRVKAKDAVFTYLAWANPIVSECSTDFNWISSVYVDPVDDMVFHVEIDANPETSELEPYVDFWGSLPLCILPEFFLNSSNPTISYTSGGAECTGFYESILDTDPWVIYSISAFNCGKYMLDYYIKNSVTVLQASPYWMGFGSIDGTEQDLDIDTVNVRVIPDITAELAEFKAGKLDLVDISFFPAERKQMQTDSSFEVQSYVNYDFSFLVFNMERENIG